MVRSIVLAAAIAAIATPVAADPPHGDVMRPPCVKPYVQKRGQCVRPMGGPYPERDEIRTIDELSLEELEDLGRQIEQPRRRPFNTVRF